MQLELFATARRDYWRNMRRGGMQLCEIASAICREDGCSAEPSCDKASNDRWRDLDLMQSALLQPEQSQCNAMQCNGCSATRGMRGT